MRQRKSYYCRISDILIQRFEELCTHNQNKWDNICSEMWFEYILNESQFKQLRYVQFHNKMPQFQVMNCWKLYILSSPVEQLKIGCKLGTADPRRRCNAIKFLQS